MHIHVVGGLYSEFCTRPSWAQLYGSAGRAAVAIASMATEVTLHTYATPSAVREFQLVLPWLAATVSLAVTPCETTVAFQYLHDSAVPSITGIPIPHLAPIQIKEERVVRFGMLEGDAVVDAEWAVYDPQKSAADIRFGDNGSRATHLAIILNLHEARSMCKKLEGDPKECAQQIAQDEGAEVVVIKLGPAGAFIWSREESHIIPAYKTPNVWKIGSGDAFVAQFARAWMGGGTSPKDAALIASRATAYYCNYKIMPESEQLAAFHPEEVKVSPAFLAGRKPKVYLAGPFFDTAQQWFIEEARRNLLELGLAVFSPFHDIGMGPAEDVVDRDLKGIHQSDIMLAIVDGLDAGTVYEIGYACALEKPVVVLCERESEESMKMVQGSGCILCNTYTTALYSTLWEAASR